METLNELIEGETAGDPISGSKWLWRDLRQLSQALSEAGVTVSHVTVRRLLQQQDDSLQDNRKATTESSPERNRQFRYLERVKHLFVRGGHPVISVDTKKKGLIGNFKNYGRAWQREPERVNVHDFPQDALIKATPYGIYDIAHNLGYFYVDVSADTLEFAVDAICRWWQRKDRPPFAHENKLLILCDAGGINGYRVRNWKKQLQDTLADPFGLEVMVCHYLTGASKWNPPTASLVQFHQSQLGWRVVAVLAGDAELDSRDDNSHRTQGACCFNQAPVSNHSQSLRLGDGLT